MQIMKNPNNNDEQYYFSAYDECVAIDAAKKEQQHQQQCPLATMSVILGPTFNRANAESIIYFPFKHI